jgi:ABC-type nitrate/sulfonate/bicarbonate transport system permease component
MRGFQAINPIVQALRPISPIAWIPVSILWFGVEDSAAIFLIFLASFFPIVTGTTSAVARDPARVRALRAELPLRRASSSATSSSRPRCPRSSPACGSRSASPGW